MSNGNIEAIYPITPVQDGILFHTVYAPESPLYFQQYACVIHGELDVSVFRRSWQHVIDRHAVLRSLLTWEGRDQPLQIVRSRVEAEWHEEDWRSHSRAEQELALASFLESDRRRGFQLDVAPLMRLALFRTRDDAHQFVWSHHHIIIDGWSIGLILDEVFRSYEVLLGGDEPDLPDRLPYREFVQWLKAQTGAEAEDYWRAALAGFESATPLPTKASTAERRWAERHAEEIVRVAPDTTQRIVDFARSEGLTLNTVLRGAWGLLLSRYANQDDVVFGTTLSGRPPDLDGSLEMIGLFINTLPVRVDVAPGQRVQDWLRGLQQQQIEAIAFESTPLVDVQGWSAVPGGEPLFETLLVFENVPNPTLTSGRLRTSEVRYHQRSNYPLAILVMPGEELELIFLYDTDRFEPSIIGRMAGQLVHLLETMTANPTAPLGEISIFPDEELHEIVHAWNATTAEYPDRNTIHELIGRAAARTPEATAVVGSGIALTYAQLEARAEAVADRLSQLGVRANDRIAVSVERSPATIVAILGVLRAGGAYVPLDPGLPPGRLEVLLEDTSAKAVVFDARPQGIGATPVVELESGGALRHPPSSPSRGLPEAATADDLAYVIHTSGSTGRPKGVAVTHRNLVSSNHARLQAYGDAVPTFLLLSPVIFDSSVAGIFSTLTQGGTLVLPAPRMEQDVHHLAELISAHDVTHTLALPTLYGLLLELVDPTQLSSLELVMVAGEPCPPELVRLHHARLPGTRLANEYGPTEATVWCTVHHTEPPAENGPTLRIPIGRPIANTQAYILDQADRPVPVGVPGELYIGGAGLAQGYLGQPDLTAEAFPTRRIADLPPTRLYRTGDIASFGNDGTIDLLGRADHQVKIRGQRIELGEIEMVLRRHDAVRDAVVVVRDDGPGSASLAAYVEPTDTLSANELRTYVAGLMPDVMVPTVIIQLDHLPKGPTGKVDRGALPDPAATEPIVGAEAVPPTGATQERLAEIWREVLGLETVGATDNFFELGGDSILSIRVIARAHRAGLTISPKQFFGAPTIAGLAEVAAEAVETVE